MTAYSNQILNCGKCQKHFSFRNLISSNNFGAFYFTDGYSTCSNYEMLIECPHCGFVFWSDEKKILEERDAFYRIKTKFLDSENGNEKQLEPKNSFEVSYMNAVTLKLWRNKAEEKELRIRAWHDFNIKSERKILFEKNDNSQLNFKELAKLFGNESYFEEEPRIEIQYPSFIYKKYSLEGDFNNNENLMSLINLLDENCDEELIMKAEAYRHLSNFSQAISILEKENRSLKFKKWHNAVLKLSLKKNNQRKLYYSSIHQE